MSAHEEAFKSTHTSEEPEKGHRDFVDSEDREAEQEYQRAGQGALKLDHHGLPLIPQPTDSPNDVS